MPIEIAFSASATPSERIQLFALLMFASGLAMFMSRMNKTCSSPDKQQHHARVGTIALPVPPPPEDCCASPRWDEPHGLCHRNVGELSDLRGAGGLGASRGVGRCLARRGGTAKSAYPRFAPKYRWY